MRRWLTATALVVFVLVAAYVLRAPILTAVARGVETSHPTMRSGAIFLLSGDARFAGRAEHAARLFHRGVAPLIVVARSADPPAALRGFYPNDTEVNVRLLRQLGVPGSAIGVITAPGGAGSTTDEGRLLAWYLRRTPIPRVTVVTSEYHTSRALWAIRRAARELPVEIRISGARDPRFHAGDWWRSEAGLLAYFEEYVKWARYLTSPRPSPA